MAARPKSDGALGKQGGRPERFDDRHLMSRDPHPAVPPPPEGEPLSPSARTAISIVLFLQIAAVLIVVFARGGAGIASGLQQRLRASVPGVRQYAQLLHNDLGYNYHLTQGGPEDDDCLVEIELNLPDGSTHAETIPDRGLTPPLRYQRHRMLAFMAAMAAGDPEAESRVPLAIAQRLVQETGATGGTIRVRRHMAQSPEEAASTDKLRGDPNSANYWSTVYDAQILVADGEVNLLKKASALERAPAARAADGAEAERP